jgi:hypothetical protein
LLSPLSNSLVQGRGNRVLVPDYFEEQLRKLRELLADAMCSALTAGDQALAPLARPGGPTDIATTVVAAPDHDVHGKFWLWRR